MQIINPPRDLEALSYGLVLLQEVCQGYDTDLYRTRARHYLAVGGNPYISDYLNSQWSHGKISTQDLVHKIERLLSDGIIS